MPPDREEQRILGLSVGTFSYFLLYLAAVDSWITVQLLTTQRGVELNPLMNWLFQSHGALTFVFAKLGLTALCLLWINRRANARHARLASIIALAIYLPLAGLHIINSQHLGG